MARYRRKPAEIEAIQYIDAESGAEIIEWLNESGAKASFYSLFVEAAPTISFTSSYQGSDLASLNDWVVKYPSGDFRRCVPDYFAERYEPANAKSVGALTVTLHLDTTDFDAALAAAKQSPR